MLPTETLLEIYTSNCTSNSFHPDMVFFVNPRGFLCDALPAYTSAQPVDFLDLDKKTSFLNWKRLMSRL